MSDRVKSQNIPVELMLFPGATDSPYVELDSTSAESIDLVYRPVDRAPIDEPQIDSWACEVAVLSNVVHLQEGVKTPQEELSRQIGRISGEGAKGTELGYWKFLLDRGYSVVDVLPTVDTCSGDVEMADLSGYQGYAHRVGTDDIGRNTLQLLSEGFLVDIATDSNDGNAHAVLVYGAVARLQDGEVETYFNVYDPDPDSFNGSTLSSCFDIHLEDPSQPNQIATGIKLPT